MNTRYYMVIIKGEIKTSEIMSCGYNRNTKKWDVKFNNGKTYSYAYLNVEKLTDPEVLNPNMYRISREGREFFEVNAIYVFRSGRESYWHICFGDGSERDYRRNDLHIIESCLAQSQSSNVFEYIKQIAGLSNLKNEETGEKLLSKKFDKISFVGSDVALAKYLNPSSLQGKRTEREYIPIFPFGCNNSQYKAVKNAMENQISVIQGPPGTGKTQTILNIIANILMQGKTVQIVSNNNSATENVYEKLSSPKYNLGFIAATLGNSKNKKLFVEHQDAAYPDFSSWKTGEDPSVLQKGIAEQSSQLKSVFDKQEKLACLRQELSQLVTEQEYFNQYVKESDVHTDSIKFKKKLSSKQWMVLWQECQLISEEKTAIGFWFKIKALFKYGVTDWSIYKQDISKIITTFQAMYYRAKQAELSAEIADIEKYLNGVNKNLLEDLCSQSMVVLNDKLARKYEGNSSRKTFSEDNLWKEPYDVLAEYPVILSTTFSSRNSLNSDVVYDYLIMDEASQVDIATGALALSCARNVVIVRAGMLAGLATGIFHTFMGIPAILAGILTQLGLYSANLKTMGKANQAVNGNKFDLLVSLRNVKNVPFYQNTIVIVAIFIVVLIAILYWFFGTELGCSLRATGCNPNMSRAQGINTDVCKVLGLMISNGLVALSSALLAQYQGFADVNMGRGAIVIGLAAVIIGEVIFGKIFKNFALRLLAVAFGGIIYYVVMQFVISLGLNTDDLKLLTAAIVAVFLGIPYLKGQYAQKHIKIKEGNK
mgnify:CR=1 FL=1